jgi:hypothetical protein
MWKGILYACCPGPNKMLANLKKHDVEWHPDATLSVAPSILVTDGEAGHRWHGYIKYDEWIEID